VNGRPLGHALRADARGDFSPVLSQFMNPKWWKVRFVVRADDRRIAADIFVCCCVSSPSSRVRWNTHHGLRFFWSMKGCINYRLELVRYFAFARII
jgi:hypothetical protein